ncbi:MAG: nicotinamide-nucleotide amidohydrolase family protein [Pigmentiphaga sp.]|jgi:competence/damage-inducible protein CinA C-terminal domain|nr:nicotinamide-nucleotide amidohydrolase family protein [Pigmentiphaga sp.]
MYDLEGVVRGMTDRGLLLVTAESCTAGLIASMLAGVPGAGALLDCAFVVYSPQSKLRALGVPDRILHAYNLTSEPVARAMAQGALARSRANVAIANTGVADGGGAGVVAGTQCFAWAFGTPGGVEMFSETRRFTGNRAQVREQAAQYALGRLMQYAERAARG